MRAFIILSFALTAYAAPQYNYQSSSQIGSNSGQFGGGSIEPSLGPYNGGSGNSYESLLPNLGSVGSNAVPTEYSKQFYFHQAAEDDFNDNDANEKISHTLKKNLNVVFIKSPENKGLENAALQLAKQAGEDKTAIYVLNKQTDISELAERLQQLKENNPHKPEVHFVKYRTPEEAANAQQQIQAQYDNLPGESKISHEGIAPVLNFIRSQASKSRPQSSNAGSINGGGDYSSSYSPPSGYLPIKY